LRARSWSGFQKLIPTNTLLAFSSAVQPQATTHSSTAALVALRASSILSFFSFISSSLAAHTLITATHQSSFANRVSKISFVGQSDRSIAFFISVTLSSMSCFSHQPPIIIVFS